MITIHPFTKYTPNFGPRHTATDRFAASTRVKRVTIASTYVHPKLLIYHQFSSLFSRCKKKNVNPTKKKVANINDALFIITFLSQPFVFPTLHFVFWGQTPPKSFALALFLSLTPAER